MKRVFLWLLAIGLVLPMLGASAAGMGFQEGIEYQRITPAVPTSVGPGKVEVVELFWYGCPHCFHFEPDLLKWLKQKPKNVVFRRVPAALNPAWRVHAQAYYTAQVLGVLDKSHEAMFNAIHRQGMLLNTPDKLADFFTRFGVKPKEFLGVFNSFAVRAKLAEAQGLVRRYGADSVPTIVVDGKYRTNASMAGGSYQRMLQVVDYLIAKETAAKKQEAASGQ